MTLAELERRVNRIDIKGQLPTFVQNTKEEMIDLNLSQLEVGKNTIGELLTPSLRSSQYADYKKSLGGKAPLGTPDLKYSGSFYDGFNLSINGLEYLINSSDSKTSDLIEKYGDDLFGLSDENKTKYAKDILFYEIMHYINRIISG